MSEENLDEYTNDEIQYAPEFEPRDIKFETASQTESFNSNCEKIELEVLNLLESFKNEEFESADLLDVFQKYKKMKKKRKKTLKNRVENVWEYLLEKETKKKKSKDNKLKFSQTVRYCCIHLIYGETHKQPTRISHRVNDYSGNGYYAKYDINYDVIMYIYDALELLGYVKLDIGDRKTDRITRVYVALLFGTLFHIDKSQVRFKKKKFINKRKHQHDLVRLNADCEDHKDKKESGNDYQNSIKKRVQPEDHFKNNDSFRCDYLNKEKNVSLINAALERIELKVVITEEVIVKSNGLLDILYLYYQNSFIDNLVLTCSVYEKDIPKFKYLNELSIINNISINVLNTTSSSLGNNHFVALPINPVINASLSRNDNDLEKNNSDTKHSKKKAKIVIHQLSFTIDKKDLYRVFSRIDLKRVRLNKHGRFYGGAWINLSSKIRAHIFVNDSKTPLVSLDYSGAHLKMCYHREGKEHLGDPYTIDKFFDTDQRKWFKTVCLITLNSKNKHEAHASIKDNLEEKLQRKFSDELVWELMEAFEKHNDPFIVKKYFYKDFAVDGMFHDSNILESCMLELLVKINIPVLPEHDELLAHEADWQLVVAHLVDAYMKEFRKIWLRKGVITKDQKYPDGFFPIIKKDGVEIPCIEIYNDWIENRRR